MAWSGTNDGPDKPEFRKDLPVSGTSITLPLEPAVAQYMQDHAEEYWNAPNPLMALLGGRRAHRTWVQEWTSRLVNAWGALKGEREELC